MPAISITDLNNAKLDVDHLAAVATSTALTVADRLGNTKRTLAGLRDQYPNAEPAAATATTQAGIATTQAGIATTQAGIATTQAGLATTAKTAAEAARDAALIQSGTYPTEAAGRSKGVKQITSLVAGTGGTNGTFALAFTGGAGSSAAGYFIVSGGIVTTVVITYAGYNYTSAPTVSFAASAGLTGASATAVISDVVANGEAYKVQGAGDVGALEYRRISSTASELIATYPSAQKVINMFDVERIVASENLLDQNDLTYERTNYLNDGISVSATQDCTNFIRVIPGKQYYFRQAASYRRAILGFADKTNASLVARVGLPSTFGNYTFVMPAGINFVKVGLVAATGETRDSALFAQFSLSQGDWLASTNLTYSGYYASTTGGGNAFRVKPGALAEVITPTPATTNLLDYSKIITSLQVNATFDALTPATGWSVSPIIPCAANNVFKFAGINDVFTRRVIFYTVDGGVIAGFAITTYSSFSGSSVTADRHCTITVPNNVSIAGFRVTVHSSDPALTDQSGKYHIYKDTTYKPFMTYRAGMKVDGTQFSPVQSAVDAYVAPYFKRPTSFLDKNIALIGDSITSNQVWVNYFAKIIRPNSVYNYSAGGRRLVNTSGTVSPGALGNFGPDAAYQMAMDITNTVIPAPDYLIICLGTNEFDKSPDTSVIEVNIDNAFTSGGATLSPLSSVDITKIPGALRYIVQTIGQVAPACQFFIWTPIPSTLNTWASQNTVGDTIRWAARRMSIPVIDLQNTSNILTLWDYPAAVVTYRNLVDGVHPFGTGVTETPATKKIAEQVASGFLNYVLVAP